MHVRFLVTVYILCYIYCIDIWKNELDFFGRENLYGKKSKRANFLRYEANAQ